MTTILIVHRYIAFAVLFFKAFITIYIIFNKFQKIERIKNLIIVIISLLHIQLIFGFLLSFRYFFFLSDLGFSFKEVMSNTSIRYKALEHPMMMLFIILLDTISYTHLKKNPYNIKAIFLFLIAFICMLGRIPFNKLFY